MSIVLLHPATDLVTHCCDTPVPPPRQVREIWLSSEDTGAYGRDIGTSLPQLLRALVEVLPPGELGREEQGPALSSKGAAPSNAVMSRLVVRHSAGAVHASGCDSKQRRPPAMLTDGRCMLRVGMTNPPFILEHLDDIAAILCNHRVFSYLHVPVRSVAALL